MEKAFPRIIGELVVDSRGGGPDVCPECREDVEEWLVLSDGRIVTLCCGVEHPGFMGFRFR